jgi:hypothetical protein
MITDRPDRPRVVCICFTLFSCAVALLVSRFHVLLAVVLPPQHFANDRCTKLPGANRHFLALRPGLVGETSLRRGSMLLNCSFVCLKLNGDGRLASETGGAYGYVVPRETQRHLPQTVSTNCTMPRSQSNSCIVPRRPRLLHASGHCEYYSLRIANCSTHLTRPFDRWNEMKIVRSFKNDPHPAIIPFHSFIITPSYALITM